MAERLLMLVVALVWSCAPASRDAADTTIVSSVDSVPDSASSDSTAPDWTVHAEGVGALRVGTPLADAARALGEPLAVSARSCDHVTPRATPPGIRFMVIRDTIVRIEVDSAGVRTKEGAQVGDSESRVLELYGARARIEPHKYTYPDGHYLVVAPPGDTIHRLIFETYQGRVTTYRSGRRPAVEYVEGCA